MATIDAGPTTGRTLIYRHSLAVRLSHWVNVLCLTVLLFSGLQIFNAHPALYWGQYGADNDPSFISMEATEDGDRVKGVDACRSVHFRYDGLSWSLRCRRRRRRQGSFPNWLTLPSYQDLSSGRRWHFFFAWLFVVNGLVYLAYGLISRHFRRDLAPAGNELTLAHLGHEVVNHARLRFPKGPEARHYNTLQKLTYLVVIFLLLPLMIATGLTMSPGFNAVAPWLLDVFGGRQSARTLHFLTAFSLVAFVAVHIAMVILSGVFNNLRSMITGYYAIEQGDER